jgi:two-component system nitrate/nitrite sensor histidine kinase NarX
MGEQPYSKLSQRINRLRWQVPLLAFLSVSADQVVEHIWLSSLPAWGHFATQLFFYGVAGSALAWWALTSLRRRVDETEAAQRALERALTALSEANQRLEFLIQVNRRLAEVEDDEALTKVILELPMEVVPALGCSLTRFDEHGRPLPAAHHGTLDPAVFEAWANHLSTTESGQLCESCSAPRAVDAVACPRLTSPLVAAAVSSVYCLTLARGAREYGRLNIYLENANHPDSREQTLLATMASEMAQALESHYLRSRELATLYRLQQARQLNNLHGTLVEVLAHSVEALEVDGGALFLAEAETTELDLLAESGRPLGTALALVQGLASGALQSEAPLTISDLEHWSSRRESLRSLLIAPLRSEDRSLGSLVLWAAHPNAFTPHHVRLIRTLAGQAALLVENHQLYLQAEHQAALAERSRLAREIHDGLAQTLSYLKLRTAQIISWLELGETQRASAGLGAVRELLTEAYVDVREAIDGLHLKPAEGKLSEWLDQVLEDFHNLSGIQVEMTTRPELVLPPEVQAQLLRIVQEALSNIRKHSAATRARLEWQADESWLTLGIADNGRGFDPADVPPVSQHGLRIMRERAELLDADFQIISRPGAGAQVVIRLPIRVIDRERHNG